MWHMEIVSDGETVAEHSNVTVVSKDFWIPDHQHVAQGYAAAAAGGEVIENICADHGEKANIELTAEGLVVVKGFWAHFQSVGGPGHEANGYYYGVTGEDGTFTQLRDLARVWDNPELNRQWNLRWLADAGPVEAEPAAAAVAETPHTPMSDVVGALGPASRGIIGG